MDHPLNETVTFTPEEIENFKKDHQAYQNFRKGTVQTHHLHHSL